MPTLIDAVDVRPRVYYRTIQIGPILFEQAPAEDDIVQIPGEGWNLTSSDNDFYPLVRLEVWDGPAPQPSGSWEYERAFQSLMADRLAVVDLNGVRYGEIELRPGRYHLRLLCRGRDQGHRPECVALFAPSLTGAAATPTVTPSARTRSVGPLLARRTSQAPRQPMS